MLGMERGENAVGVFEADGLWGLDFMGLRADEAGVVVANGVDDVSD